MEKLTTYSTRRKNVKYIDSLLQTTRHFREYIGMEFVIDTFVIYVNIEGIQVIDGKTLKFLKMWIEGLLE